MNKKNNLALIGFMMLFFINFTATAQTVKLCFKSSAGDFAINSGGTVRDDIDDKLLNPANFGPSGTSKFTFTTYNFGTNTVTYAQLVAQGCQIFDAGINVTDGGSGTLNTSYSEAEENDLYTWSTDANKGVIIGFQGYANRWVSGHVSNGTGNINPNTFTTIGNRIFSGTFGAVSGFNQGGTYQGTYSAQPSSSCTAIQTANGLSAGVINSVSGDVYLADVDMVSYAAGDLSYGPDITNDQDKFFGNLYEGLAKLAIFKPTNACNFFACNAGTNAPAIGISSIASTCPATTVNLTSITASNLPSGTQLTWHTGIPATNANKISNPASYGTAGTVYAAIFDPSAGCYAGDGFAVEDLTVTITTCATCNAGSAAPTLIKN